MTVASGDIMYRGASAWLRLPKAADGKLLRLVSGYPAWSDSAASSDDLTTIRDQLAYLSFRKDTTTGPVQLNGFWFDPFSDQTGMNTGSCTGYAYDSANKLYKNSRLGSIDGCTTTENALYFDNLTHGAAQCLTLSGTQLIGAASFTLAKYGSPTGSAYAKIYAVTGTVGSTAVPTGSALATSAAVDVSTIPGSPTETFFEFTTPYSASGDIAIAVEYANSDISNGFTANTNNTTSIHSGNEAINTGSWSTYGKDISFSLRTVDNSTLISNTATAASQPSKSRISLFIKPVSTITINTDVKAYATRDAGSNWAEFTLAKVADLQSSIQQWAGEVTFSGTGTSMILKMTSANGKAYELTAWGLAWY